MDMDPYEYDRLKELYKYSPESLTKEENEYIKNSLESSFSFVSSLLSSITGKSVTYNTFTQNKEKKEE